MSKRIYDINGNEFSTLEEFFDVVSRVLIPGTQWGRNLNAFNDILRGGFGTPEEGFVIRWSNSALSRKRLGYPETVRQLERHLMRCDFSNRQGIGEDLERARRNEGSTVFDWLLEIIAIHCQGGNEEEDGVELLIA